MPESASRLNTWAGAICPRSVIIELVNLLMKTSLALSKRLQTGMLQALSNVTPSYLKLTVYMQFWQTGHLLLCAGRLFLAPAVTVGETEGAMDSASVFFHLFFCL